MKLSVHERIGEGASAEVYRATDLLDRQVAVRVLKLDEASDRALLDQAKLLARANHKNIARVFWADRMQHPTSPDRVVWGVIMELLTGESLSTVLSGPPLTPGAARRIGLSLLDAVQYLAGLGAAHGDLHADNVVVVDGEVKLIDPAYLRSGSQLSTSSRKERERLDAHQTSLRLSDLLAKTGGNSSYKIAFLSQLSGDPNLQELRSAFDRAFQSTEATAEPSLPLHLAGDQNLLNSTH